MKAIDLCMVNRTPTIISFNFIQLFTQNFSYYSHVNIRKQESYEQIKLLNNSKELKKFLQIRNVLTEYWEV